MKVELKYGYDMDSLEFIDQLVRARLKNIYDNESKWNDNPEVVEALKTLLTYMGDVYGGLLD
jgi:hypothetical protein